MENYYSAANRHFFDAELLLSQSPSRLPNASHLYGIAAECAVKTLIQNNRPPTASPSVYGHLHGKIKQSFITSNAARSNAQLQKQVIAAIDRFANWTIDQRYCTSIDVQFTFPRVSSEQQGARDIIRLRDRWLQGVM